LTQNPHRFHLKKGRLTEFWDKNSWMKTVYLMNGHERSERSRSFNNRDRDGKIKNLKERI
jgi:PHD/YefM family antitoxin component YafN of YafNO toxin-antitoxin module